MEREALYFQDNKFSLYNYYWEAEYFLDTYPEPQKGKMHTTLCTILLPLYSSAVKCTLFYLGTPVGKCSMLLDKYKYPDE